ncbi:MAG: tRNA (N6-isopentenyl adenosine(37)-C2)-methylthiotransferase MiaB [Lachnospiraceae bacterium]|nr:tRNA (N6-isopentenyl adenosine(37)-C2)-methylthiotransferase MiaB [Lachnospiraceae bacterium]
MNGIEEQIPVTEPERQNHYMQKTAALVAELSAKRGRKLTCYIATFGCQMNARDSEKLLGILKAAGYVETDDERNADLVLMNTCTVRDNANQRVYGRLGVLKGYKKENPDMRIILCGCMMQEPEVIEKIKKSYPHVDLIFGTHNIYMLAELLYTQLKEGKQVISVKSEAERIVEDIPAERKYAFKSGVNIMFGCDNFCSYCIVPYVRGRERSREMNEILDEVKRLADSGVKEVMLLGQNVNSYGKNCLQKTSFARLLSEVEKIDGIRRIRFMTPHPKDLNEDVIDIMRASKKICHHLHLPLQSGSTRILKLMNRHYTKEQYIDLALHVRERIPDIAITTDIIVGFPTETVQDIDDTLDVIKRVEFDNAFTFEYSKRTGTPAASMEGQVTEAFVKEQFARVLDLVQTCSKKRAVLVQGQTMEALTEEVNEHDPSLLTGRLSNNLLVHFPADPSLIGEIVKVELTECRGFYYLGRLVQS